MMEKEMEHKPIDPADMAKAKEHVMALQGICEKSGCSVEHLVEMAMDQGGESEEEDMDEESPMDKGKVALIIAKMKGARGEE
jgi:hypothetical protein